MDRGGRGAFRGMLPLLALQTANEYYRLERKPPVIAGLLAANTLIYLRPAFLDSIIPRMDEVWFNAHLIIKYKEFKRFFLSPFYHMGEPHLVYNMMSLLWKGIQLETSMGSIKFASMTAALLCMSQGITLLLSKSLLLFDYERPYYSEYAVGFSGVLFAMKVVLQSQSDDNTSVHGIILPSKYVAWAELFIIQLIEPNVSFLGHLGGILAGLLYVCLRDMCTGSNPLNRIFSGISFLLNWPVRFTKGLFGFQYRTNYGQGTVGSGGKWRCRVCTYDNPGLLFVCEMCGTSRDGNSGSSTSSSNNLSGEELRLRRIARYSR
ncbi:hypothetical protein V2J09_010939 [Rumex salicifolius]